MRATIATLSLALIYGPAAADGVSDLAQLVEATDLRACQVDQEAFAFGIGRNERGLFGLGWFSGAYFVTQEDKIVAMLGNSVFVVEGNALSVVTDGQVQTGTCAEVGSMVSDIIGGAEFAEAINSGIGSQISEAAADAERKLSERESILEAKTKAYDEKVKALNQLEADLSAREKALIAKGG